MKISFSPPDISELEISEVVSALRSGWITTGPRTKELENLLSEYCGTPKAVCLNSATSAEELNLHILGIGPGDEVIVPAYTYTATASAVIHTGASVVFADSCENSPEIDYDRLEKLITEKTKAIILVDIAGIVCDYKRVFDIAESKKFLFRPSTKIQEAIGRIAVISDAAHALGAERDGLKAGNIADFTSFSFHAVKNFTTGEGGASTWRSIPGIDNNDIYKIYQLYSLHGQDKDALEKTKLGSWEYDILGPWYKCNMTDIMAAIGLKQFERYPALLSLRREIIRKYDNAFSKKGIYLLEHFTEASAGSGHLYITRIPGADTQKRNEIITKMAENGIACNVHYKPLPMMTAYKKMGFDISDFPNAYNFYINEITLPLHTLLTDEETDYIIKKFCEVI